VRLGNGLWEHTSFNSRLQPTQVGLGTSAANSSTLQLDFAYGLLVNGTLDVTKNNGNVQSQTITVPGMTQPYVQTYLYDVVNTLSSAVETNPQISPTTPTWKQVYSYDQYGNRTLAPGTTSPATLDATTNPEVSPADNRITSAGYAYDNAGNLLCDPQHPCGNGSSTSAPSSSISLNYFAYDAENRMVQSAAQAGGMQYGYDGDGRRVQKLLGTQVT
jgi:YD repeat-containing protein